MGATSLYIHLPSSSPSGQAHAPFNLLPQDSKPFIQCDPPSPQDTASNSPLGTGRGEERPALEVLLGFVVLVCKLVGLDLGRQATSAPDESTSPPSSAAYQRAPEVPAAPLGVCGSSTVPGLSYASETHLRGDACPAECEICGSGQNQDCMVICILCNGYQHRYCLMLAPLEMRGGWCCSECQEKANGNPKPIQGGSKNPMLDNNRWSMAHQIGVKTPQIYENSKVKFIPCEEAALLTKERPAARRRTKFVVRRTHSQIRPVSPPNMKCVSPSRQVRPASPPNVKPSSSMKSILPSRQVGPSSPRSMKQKCVSPSGSDDQVLSLRPCVVASQNLIKADDINRRQKVRSGATIPMVPQNTKLAVKENVHLVRPKEEKVEHGDKGKGKSRVECQPREENAFNSSVANIGCQSGPKSLHHNIDMPVIISSSVEYARRPPPQAICWRGCIVLSNGENRNLGEFKAYHPARVSPRVLNIAKNMSNNLQLKILPRMKYWPKTFEQICPVYDDVALIFFSAEHDWYVMLRHHLFEAYCGFVMKAYIDDMMLLIYSSELLPPDAQWIDGENYLWGVFVKPKPKSNPVT
ncbi:uncharacterized protein LOC124695789 [Lolium rigidum]|uniref:uncharacterized protein LOC124695789 n=1 Tax=Lolium rigidum TaxID=89674 RepID=UPI001F5D627A|nr:uncharacterized protein LOC124695789 [Lolium rigidum]